MSRRKYPLGDYTGAVIKFLTIEGRHEPKEDDTADTAKWKAVCACGNECIITHKQVTGKKKTTCGCAMRSTKYQSGNRYGRLTIVKEGDRVDYGNGQKVRQVWCKCDCGNPNLTLVRTNNLSSGNTTSCGCFGDESRTTHGMSHTRVYQIWEGMKRRCRPDLAEDFPYHAGKGITFEDSWNSFDSFYQDMGDVPSGMSLDRIDPNGNYCKENCRWATNSVQGYNKGLDPNNTSGKSGVSWYTGSQKWSAEIYVDGEHIRLGMYSVFEDAVKAREEAELKYYGWNKE